MDYLGNEDPQLARLVDKLDLKTALGDMDPREKAIIYLKFYSDFSQSAIPWRLGISQVHVSRLQRNALKALKRKLLNQNAECPTTPESRW